MSRVAKQHGGKRAGAGRKPTLVDAQKLLVRFEARHLSALDIYARDHQLTTRAAAIRGLIEELLLPGK